MTNNEQLRYAQKTAKGILEKDEISMGDVQGVRICLDAIETYLKGSASEGTSEEGQGLGTVVRELI